MMMEEIIYSLNVELKLPISWYAFARDELYFKLVSMDEEIKVATVVMIEVLLTSTKVFVLVCHIFVANVGKNRKTLIWKSFSSCDIHQRSIWTLHLQR